MAGQGRAGQNVSLLHVPPVVDHPQSLLVVVPHTGLLIYFYTELLMIFSPSLLTIYTDY